MEILDKLFSRKGAAGVVFPEKKIFFHLRGLDEGELHRLCTHWFADGSLARVAGYKETSDLSPDGATRNKHIFSTISSIEGKVREDLKKLAFSFEGSQEELNLFASRLLSEISGQRREFLITFLLGVQLGIILLYLLEVILTK